MYKQSSGIRQRDWLRESSRPNFSHFCGLKKSSIKAWGSQTTSIEALESQTQHNTKTIVFRLKPNLNGFSVKQACTKMWNIWSGYTVLGSGCHFNFELAISRQHCLPRAVVLLSMNTPGRIRTINKASRLLSMNTPGRIRTITKASGFIEITGNNAEYATFEVKSFTGFISPFPVVQALFLKYQCVQIFVHV